MCLAGVRDSGRAADGKKTIPWVAGFPRRAKVERFADT